MTTPATLPCHAGIGLRAPHTPAFLTERPDIAWVEVHSENFFGGGAPLATLKKVSAHYPLSLHGVGLGIASPTLDKTHLQQLRTLCEAIQPAALSDHLCWNALHGQVFNDLLPPPYTEEALTLVLRHVDEVQHTLNRQIFLENLSSYVTFTHSTLTEAEFLETLASRTGCGLLLDLQNLHVNKRNLGQDPMAFMATLSPHHIKEYHLAGASGTTLPIVDSHDRPVSREVWELYEHALHTIGPRPTLIEWDQDLPPLDTLLSEAAKAEERLEACHACL